MFVEIIATYIARFSALFIINFLFISGHSFSICKRERETFGMFSVNVHLMVLELASLEKKKKEDFFKICLLGFYKVEVKLFVLRRVRSFCIYPVCWLLPLF